MRPENVGWRADQKREIGPKECCSKVYKNGGPVGRTLPNFTVANRYVKGGMVFLFGGDVAQPTKWEWRAARPRGC